MPFSAGTYTVVVNFTTDAASPPIDIGQLDLQMADLATALNNCILRDGTGAPTAAIDFGAQDVTGMNSLTITNALSDTATLTLPTAGSQIIIERSSGGGTFTIGSDSVGGSALSLKNNGGSSSEIQVGGGTLTFRTNAVTRLTLSSAGQWVIPANTNANTATMIVGSGTALTSGGDKRVGITFSSVANMGVFVGQDPPTFTAAKGSLYLSSNGSSSSTRLYIASDSVGGWVAVTTAS